MKLAVHLMIKKEYKFMLINTGQKFDRLKRVCEVKRALAGLFASYLAGLLGLPLRSHHLLRKVLPISVVQFLTTSIAMERLM